ncbi:MAG: NAD(P)-dependent oxidoreductase [Deltaproteobacteria bacterium]|nr:MAG: NAD(P)-dependent oxidoreductase [Deltaproteobacteria bacterium]
MKKPKFLVTGATGFIGHEVSRQLAAQGYRPKLMIRKPLQQVSIRDFDADFVAGNLRNPESLTRAVEGVDCVLHLGARATFESYNTLKPVILDGSLALMKAAIEAGVKSFVYSSSLLVYGDLSDKVDGNTPANPLLDYGRVKLDTEKTLTQMATSAGINFAALRLPHVYGPMDLYFQQLRNGRLILPGLGRNTFTHLHVADAARLLITSGEQGYASISPVGDNMPATWAEFLDVVKLHYPNARVLALPQWLALATTTALTPFRRFRPYPGLETPGAVRTYNCSIAVKPGLVWEELGLKPLFPTIYEGVPAVINQYVGLG